MKKQIKNPISLRIGKYLCTVFLFFGVFTGNVLSQKTPVTGGGGGTFGLNSKKINMNVVVPQPYSPYLDDIYYDMPLITIINTSTKSLKVALRAELTGNNKYIRTKANRYSDDIVLAPGAVAVLSRANFNYSSLIGRGVSDHNISQSEIDNLTKTGVLPEGNYSYCLYAYSHEADGSYVPIPINGMPNKQPMCANFQLFAANPPVITNPMNGNIVNGNVPIVFNWTQPAPIASVSHGFIEYDLTVLRLSGLVSPKQEIDNYLEYGTGYAYTEKSIKNTTFVLNPETVPFDFLEDRRYAVIVVAKDTKKKTYFKNQGRSEVISFTYKENIIRDHRPNTGDNPPAGQPEIDEPEQLNRRFISGRMAYRFKGEDEVINYGGSGLTLLTNSDPTPFSNSKSLSNTRIQLVTAYIFKGSAPGQAPNSAVLLKTNSPIFSSLPDSLKAEIARGAGISIVAITNTKEDGTFQFDLNNVVGKFGRITSFKSTKPGSVISGNIYKVLRIRVDNPYYCSPEVNIVFDNNGEANLGNIVSFLKSYSLEVTVRGREQGKNYVSKSNIPITMLTGDRNNSVVDLPDIGFPGTKASNEQGKIIFTNLVQHNPNNPNDVYKLKFTRGQESGAYSYQTKTVPYKFEADGDIRPFPFYERMVYNTTNVSSSTRMMWNSELDIQTFTTSFQLDLAAPAIYGNVTYKPNIEAEPLSGVNVKMVAYRDNPPPGVSKTKVDYLRTDQNGDYKAINLLVLEENGAIVGPERELTVTHPGYGTKRIPAQRPNKIAPLKHGEQLVNQNFLLEPLGLLVGYVEDENGTPVEADIDVGGIAQGTTKLVVNSVKSAGGRGKSSLFGGVQQLDYRHEFRLPAPSGSRKVTISPKNVSFDEKDTIMMIKESNHMEGTDGIAGTPIKFVVYKSQKRIRFRVIEYKDPLKPVVGSPTVPIAGATVTLLRAKNPITQVTDAQGYVNFVFESAGTSFDFKITPPSNKNYQTKEVTLTNVQNTTTVRNFGNVSLKPGVSVSGKVTKAGTNTPIPNAIVYYDLGNGKRIQTYTNSSGEYRLSNLPKGYSITIWASKPNSLPNIISQSKTASTILSNPVINFSLEETDLYLTNIFGYELEIKSIKNQGTAGTHVNIDGNLTLPTPAYIGDVFRNFKFKEVGQTIPFRNLVIVKTKIGGVPRHKPVNNVMVTDLAKLELILHDNYEVIQEGFSGGSIVINAEDDAANGKLMGYIKIDKSSFTFTEEQLNFSGDLFLTDKNNYLSKNLTSLTPKKQTKTGFGLSSSKTSIHSNRVNFKLRKFDGFAIESWVEDNIIKLNDIKLATRFQDPGSEVMYVSVGDLEVKPDKVAALSGSTPIDVKIGSWNLTASNWFMSARGNSITFQEGVVETGSINIPVYDIDIKPNHLSIGSYDLNKISYGGILDVDIVSDNTNFGYNPGQKKYELRIIGDGNNHAVEVQKFPGMPEGHTIKFESLSLFSDGSETLTLGNINNNFTYNNFLKVKPLSFSTQSGHVELRCNIDMEVPNVPEVSGFIKVTKEGNNLASELGKLDFAFDATNSVRFITRPSEDPKQTITGREYTIEGYLVKKNEFELKSKFTRTRGRAHIDVVKSNQKVLLNKGNEPEFGLKNVEGETSADFTAEKWSHLELRGIMFGYESIEEEETQTFEVRESVNAKGRQKIRVQDIPNPFDDMDLSLDFLSGEFRGGGGFEQSFAGVSIAGQSEFYAGKHGFYFASSGSGQIDSPGASGRASSGIIIGKYTRPLPPDVVNNFVKYSYRKELPKPIRNGISGMYTSAEIPVYVGVPNNYEIDLGIVEVKVGFNIGVDFRSYFTFGAKGAGVGMGILAYLQAYAEAGVDLGIVHGKIRGELLAELLLEQYVSSALNFEMTGCASLTLKGSIKGCVRTCLLACEVCKTWRGSIGFGAQLKFNNSGFTTNIITGNCSGGDGPGGGASFEVDNVSHTD